MKPTIFSVLILAAHAVLLSSVALSIASIHQIRDIEGPPKDPTKDGWYVKCGLTPGADAAAMTWTLNTCNLTGNFCQDLCSW